MKKINLFALVLVFCLAFFNVNTAFAQEASTDLTPEDLAYVYNYIFSEEANQIINANIDFNTYGTQSVNLGNNITYIYINEKSLTRSVVSDTMTSIFTYSDQTVATLRLACTFTYNGSTVSIGASDYRATADAIPNWSCTADATDSKDSNGDVYVSATYKLYYQGNYSANGYMDMSCNKNGVVTKHYPWS